jgi:hypothetical protein
MMRTLRQQQSLFAKLLAWHIAWIYEVDGWAVTFADVYRPDKSGHMDGSLHYIRLAADLNLFVDGIWQTEDCPQWRLIGSHWKSLDPDARWGGDFKTLDLDHFSLEWGGKQ